MHLKPSFVIDNKSYSEENNGTNDIHVSPTAFHLSRPLIDVLFVNIDFFQA